MSYTHLIGLYFAETANADLTDPEARALLHVRTPLEDLVAQAVREGRDVVLTGNPGDGKSHLVRLLKDRGRLENVWLEPDLSAKPTREVVQNWQHAVTERLPFVLCANEGPLKELVAAMVAIPSLAGRKAELEAQLGHLLVNRSSELPKQPRELMLVDLADRVVLDPAMIASALDRIASDRFLPQIGTYDVAETSAGRNLLYLRQIPEARSRLASALAAAGARCGEHVTFRQLWAAIAYAVTRSKPLDRLEAEFREDAGLLGSLPLDNLVHRDGRGLLLGAARTFADAVLVTDPDLDEQIWATGQPTSGRWYIEEFPAPEPPARVWAAGSREAALEHFKAIKRAVAFAHERGGPIIERLGEARTLPSREHDSELLSEIIAGLRAVYVAPAEAVAAPEWLGHGLPLWTGLTYRDVAIEERPQVAVRSCPPHEFEILRPMRAPWLGDALGTTPEEVWVCHRASGISLRVDPSLLFVLSQARQSSGPLATPEPVHRFLARLAGWDEQNGALEAGRDSFAILERARGPLVAVGAVQTWHGGRASYALR